MDDVPVKYPYIGGKRWAFMSWADIPDAKNQFAVYLRRLRVIQTPLFAIYLHWIFKIDDDRDPHDHPFAFWSWVLRGGYTERLWLIRPGLDKGMTHHERRWNRWTLHKMEQRYAHMIQHLQPDTITLVITGPKNNEGRWGFYPPSGFVRWQDYNRDKFSVSPEYDIDEMA